MHSTVCKRSIPRVHSPRWLKSIFTVAGQRAVNSLIFAKKQARLQWSSFSIFFCKQAYDLSVIDANSSDTMRRHILQRNKFIAKRWWGWKFIARDQPSAVQTWKSSWKFVSSGSTPKVNHCQKISCSFCGRWRISPTCLEVFQETLLASVSSCEIPASVNKPPPPSLKRSFVFAQREFRLHQRLCWSVATKKIFRLHRAPTTKKTELKMSRRLKVCTWKYFR